MVKRKDVRMCHGYGIIKAFVKLNSTWIMSNLKRSLKQVKSISKKLKKKMRSHILISNIIYLFSLGAISRRCKISKILSNFTIANIGTQGISRYDVDRM